VKGKLGSISNRQLAHLAKAARKDEREKRKYPERFDARLWTQAEIDKEFPGGYPVERLMFASRLQHGKRKA